MDRFKIAIRAAVVLLATIIIVSIVPALLSARNDLAVILGVIVVICVPACFLTWAQEIVTWFKDVNKRKFIEKENQ